MGRMHALVTGGAGFIGSHLAERLVREGWQVRVLDNFSTGRRDNLSTFAGKIDVIEGDVADAATCRRACQGVEVVLHQAAIPSVPKSVADPLTSHRVNVDGVLHMLAAARDGGVKRFVYASSSSVYGESEVLPKVESMPPSPLSPYAVQKLTGEYYCRVFAHCYGLATIALRYFNVFGPRQDPASQYAAAIPAFITSLLRGERPTVYGDGLQTRDFTSIENVVQANLLAVSADGVAGQVVNIGAGGCVTVNDIITQIGKLLDAEAKPRHVDARQGDIRHSWADIGEARRVLRYEPAVSLSDGLARTVAWYQENG